MDVLDKKYLKEKPNCPICEGNSKIIDNVHTINENASDILNLRECLSCGHWWIDPMPDQEYLIKLYQKGSEYVVSKGYKGSDELEKVKFEEFYEEIIKYFKDKNPGELNYLEVGCGSGYLLNYFSEKLNICRGIEPGEWKPEGNIVNSIDELNEDIKFDIIIVKDVLEHVEDPVGMLKKIKSLSNDNAIINLSFPNKDCLIAKLFIGKWPMVRPIGHLHYFSKKSIKKMFDKSGWALIKEYTYWPVESFNDLFKNFDWNFKNPIKLIYRFTVRLLIKQIIMGKDQWHVTGRAE